jgi:hypothetical protein
METTKYFVRAILLGLGLLAFSPAQAVNGGYFGFNAGSTDDEVLDETDSGFRLVLGAQPNEYFGYEIAFVNLGDYVDGYVSQYGVSFDLIGYIPVTDSFSIFGKAGLFSWTFEDDTGFSGTLEQTGSDSFVGFGAQFNTSDKVAIIVETATYEVFDGDVSLVSAGVKIGF